MLLTTQILWREGGDTNIMSYDEHCVADIFHWLCHDEVTSTTTPLAERPATSQCTLKYRLASSSRAGCVAIDGALGVFRTSAPEAK